jgi:hypothetical protein
LKTLQILKNNHFISYNFHHRATISLWTSLNPSTSKTG